LIFLIRVILLSAAKTSTSTQTEYYAADRKSRFVPEGRNTAIILEIAEVGPVESIEYISLESQLKSLG